MTQEFSKTSVYRILDAAINRAAEGLRVVEDFLRMNLGDRFLSGQAKQLRHQLALVTAEIDPTQLIAARDAQRDVGRHNQTETEYVRESDWDLVQSNISRVKQSFRSIEEYSKTFSATLAKKVEQLRYQTYELEKAILNTVSSLRSLDGVHLCVLIDGRDSLPQFETLVQQLIDANVGMLQLRDKRLDDRQLIALGKRLTEMTSRTSTRWVMNDRSDLAMIAGADGVHVGQNDLHVSDARRVVGASKWVGVSTHNIEQARDAVRQGASYIGVGPTFESRTKSIDTIAGTEFVQQVASEIRLPAFAIGGIDTKNLGRVIEAGATRIAVHGVVADAEKPGAVAVELNSKLVNVKTS